MPAWTLSMPDRPTPRPILCKPIVDDRGQYDSSDATTHNAPANAPMRGQTNGYLRLRQLSRISIVRTTARIGGMGNANPHQKTAPTGSRASARMAPAF